MEVSSIALENGATRLGVALVEEGIFLRKAGFDAPILVHGMTPEEQAEQLLLYDITFTVCNIKVVERLNQIAAKIHLKV